MGKARKKPVRRKYQTKRWAEAALIGGVVQSLGTRAMQEVKPAEKAPMHVKRSIAINQDRWSNHRYTGQPAPQTQRISPGLYSINKMIDAEFGDPWQEVQVRKQIIAKQNGEVRPVKWHEIVVQSDQFRKLALCFYADKAVWTQIEFSTTKIRFSRLFRSSASAMLAHNRGQYSWSPYKEYKPSGA